MWYYWKHYYNYLYIYKDKQKCSVCLYYKNNRQMRMYVNKVNEIKLLFVNFCLLVGVCLSVCLSRVPGRNFHWYVADDI